MRRSAAGAAMAAGFAFLVVLCSSSAAEDLSSGRDFKFMELRMRLREAPEGGPQARRCLFGMGEYYFSQKSPAQAAEYFRRFDPRTSQSTEDLLAAVYLLQCASFEQDARTVVRLENELLEALSSRRFFAAFDDARSQTWSSELGYRYDFREEVDRWEILLNGEPFYTIRLS